MMRYIVYLLLLLASPVVNVQAQIGVVQYAQRDTAGTGISGGSNTMSVLAGVSTAGSSIIVVEVQSWGSATAPVVTDNQGNTYGAGQLIGSGDAPSGGPKMRVWYIYGNSIGSASHTFSVTTSAPGYRTIRVIAATGTLTSADPKDQVTVSTGVGVLNPSVTPTQDGALVLSFVSSSTNAVAPTLSGSFTLLNSWGFLPSGSFLGASAYYIQPTAGPIAPVFAYSGAFTVGITFSIKKAANASTGAFNLLLK